MHTDVYTGTLMYSPATVAASTAEDAKARILAAPGDNHDILAMLGLVSS